MKKLFIPLLLAGSVLFAGAPDALAQRGPARTITTTKLAGVQETFDHTEAFHLEAGHEMLVTPLVATVKVLSKNNDGKTYERATFTGASRQDIPSGLAGNEYLVSKVMDGKRVAAINVELLKAQVTYDFCRETGISAPRTAAGTFLCIADPVSCRFCEIFLEKGFTNEPQKIII